MDGDLTRLAQVFGNLLTNAAKYTDRGGRIRLDRRAAGRRRGGVGRGTPASASPPSTCPGCSRCSPRWTRPLERSQGGLGIGLALVKSLVEMHGGRVEARSDGPGKGSEFVVRLPLLVEQPAATASRRPRPGERGRRGPARRRVLVADDNVDSAESLAMLLSAAWATRSARPTTASEAVEPAERFRPDVVLLDIGMPRMNGYEAARQIRQQPWGRGGGARGPDRLGAGGGQAAGGGGRVRPPPHEAGRPCRPPTPAGRAGYYGGYGSAVLSPCGPDRRAACPVPRG